MAGLYLTCVLCGRKQAEGLLSRGYWGHVDAPPHGTLRACPTCKEANVEWEILVIQTVDGSAPQAAYQAGSYRAR